MHRCTPLAAAIACALAAGPVAADPPELLQEVVVTATPLGESQANVVQPTTVMAGDALRRDLQPTLGQTLASLPGVSSTSYGPAASRPVIRGLGGDRVLVLDDGLTLLDAAGLSEDHAVALDPGLARQIEVLRGPATLLYGSGAAGGVVNVVSERVPTRLPEGIDGAVEMRADSASSEGAGFGRLDAAIGSLALHADAFWRETEDLEIPGYAQSDRLRAELVEAGEAPDDVRGRAPNTWSRSNGGAFGASWIGERGFLGAAVSSFDTDYGIPLEDGAKIVLEQTRVDLNGAREFAGWLQRVRVRGATSDYEHAELEPSGEVGTRFANDGRELRLAFDHREVAGWYGTFGLQWQSSDFDAAGEEAFVPSSETRTLAAFAFEQREFGPVAVEFGLRHETQEVEAANGLPTYDDGATSVSGGALWRFRPDYGLALHVTRTERNPSATELYADGPHAATGQYEIGNPGFGRERAMTLDIGLRREAGPARFELVGFCNWYDGYLYLAPTGDVFDEDPDEPLPVYAYDQRDARLCGAEFGASLPIATVAGGQLALGVTADTVRGTLDGGGDLPRLPPARLGASVTFERAGTYAALSARHALAQERVAAFERETDGWTIVDLELSQRVATTAGGVLLFVRGNNLFDEDARQHTSPLKDRLPLAGRSFAAGVRLEF